jgi:hypothetical protein
MMLNFAAYVFAFLAYYVCGYAFQYGGVAINAAPTNLGGTPTLNHFLIGSGLWGFLGGKGFFLSGPGYDSGSLCLTLFEVVFMETAGYITVIPILVGDGLTMRRSPGGSEIFTLLSVTSEGPSSHPTLCRLAAGLSFQGFFPFDANDRNRKKGSGRINPPDV